MKWGLIARADTSRGLGRQTYDIWRKMRPDRTLIIDSTGISPYPMDADFVERADMVVPREELAEIIDVFVEGLDLLYTFETPYDDYAVYLACRRAGCVSICHVNPELWPFTGSDYSNLPRPDVVWLPTYWRQDVIEADEARAGRPGRLRHISQPVDRERFKERTVSEVRTVGHVAGHRAMNDRNGTALFFAALSTVTAPCRAVVYSQSAIPRHYTRGISSRVDLTMHVGNVDDPADLYSDIDALILPRRYGGLCLPAQEAMSCGLPLLMTGCAPQKDEYLHPEAGLHVQTVTQVRMQGGMIPTHHAHPRGIARAIDRLVRDPEWVTTLAEWSRRRAETLSWETMEYQWREAFDEATRVAA